MTTKSTASQADTPRATIKPTTAKEVENTRVKQGLENAAKAEKDAGPPYTTKREDQGHTTTVLDADGKPTEVNVEAANTTATLARQGVDENPTTRALREQARQNEVVPADDGQDDKNTKK